jgi:hypothetical protein
MLADGRGGELSMRCAGGPQPRAGHVRRSKVPPHPRMRRVGSLGATGRSVGGDVSKIGTDFGCSEQLAKVKIVELGKMARERDVVQSGTAGLTKDLSQETLNLFETPLLKLKLRNHVGPATNGPT